MCLFPKFINEVPFIYPQNSIIGQITGTVDPDVIVIIGAHMDSGAFVNPETGISDFPGDCSERIAPGADDNGSGAVVVMETFRAIVDSGFRPERTLQFILFSGEERGFTNKGWAGKTGSHNIAREYAKTLKRVAFMWNMDSISVPFNSSTNGDQPNPLHAVDNSLGIIAHPAVHPNIPELAADCTLALTTRIPGISPEGAASDFESFQLYGYPAGNGVETDIFSVGLNPFSPRLRHHTVKDTIDKVDFEYVKDWARMTVGIAVEGSFSKL